MLQGQQQGLRPRACLILSNTWLNELGMMPRSSAGSSLPDIVWVLPVPVCPYAAVRNREVERPWHGGVARRFVREPDSQHRPGFLGYLNQVRVPTKDGAVVALDAGLHDRPCRLVVDLAPPCRRGHEGQQESREPGPECLGSPTWICVLFQS